ncbi:hypothetical protein D3C78_454860 [compost metagenome]
MGRESSCSRVITEMERGISLIAVSVLVPAALRVATMPVVGPQAVSKLRLPSIFTSGRLMASSATGARLKLSAPFCTRRRLLPCRAWDSACNGLSSPFTAGAVLPAVRAGSMLSAMPASAAMRFSVLASGADGSW